MSDPLGEFARAIEDIFLYLDTAFATRWREVNDERNHMLRSSEELFQVPFLEVLPRFKSSGITPANLEQALQGAGVDEQVVLDFKAMMRTGLLRGIDEADAPLHDHQIKVLQEATEGRHCVITSPTGSGKTEAFLMPLFLHRRRGSTTR